MRPAPASVTVLAAVALLGLSSCNRAADRAPLEAPRFSVSAAAASAVIVTAAGEDTSAVPVHVVIHDDERRWCASACVRRAQDGSYRADLDLPRSGRYLAIVEDDRARIARCAFDVVAVQASAAAAETVTSGEIAVERSEGGVTRVQRAGSTADGRTIRIRECVLIGRSHDGYGRAVADERADDPAGDAHAHGAHAHGHDRGTGIAVAGAKAGDYLAWVRVSDGDREWSEIHEVTVPRVSQRPWWETAHKH